MGKVLRFWNSVRHKLPTHHLKLEDAADPSRFIGCTVKAQRNFDQDPESVVINAVKGSLAHPKHFEINGTHWVSMFSYFTQMLEDRVPSKEEEAEFELATQIKKIEDPNAKKKPS